MKDQISAPSDPTIRFVIPYFGRWPYWMDFFLESCRHNPSIDWLFYTDCGVPQRAPSNTQFVEISFAKYCEKVSAKLGIDFCPPSPYKLCDIKPALGYVHADDVAGYDFWAFGDIDVIYGDLRRHFTAQRLARKDLFSTHHRRISGHLCLMRNTDELRVAFKRIPSWQARFADPKHQALDESAFSHLFVKHKNFPEPLRRIASRLYRACRRSEFIETHSTYVLMPDGSRVQPERWKWSNGQLTNDVLEHELPYFHFLYWKTHDWKMQPVEALVSPNDLSSHSGWEVSASGWRALASE